MTKLLDWLAYYRFWLANFIWMLFWNSILVVYEVYYGFHIWLRVGGSFNQDILSFVRGGVVVGAYFMLDWFWWGGRHYRCLNDNDVTAALGRWLRPRHWLKEDGISLLALYKWCEKHKHPLVIYERKAQRWYGFKSEDLMVHARMSI